MKRKLNSSNSAISFATVVSTYSSQKKKFFSALPKKKASYATAKLTGKSLLNFSDFSHFLICLFFRIKHSKKQKNSALKNQIFDFLLFLQIRAERNKGLSHELFTELPYV